MEPVWEFKWAVWNEVKLRFVPTPIWLTDEEARSDWYAYDLCVYRLEHTRRERNRCSGPYVDPPASDLPWQRERKLRAERARYGLPPFFTPLDAELRKLWTERPEGLVRTLALEVQCGRYAISEIEAIAAEGYWHLQKEHATVAEARQTLGRLRWRLMQELQRIGPIKWERR
ncbi:hypothetical protein P5W99_11120 [Paraburkholderia sp. A3BS-1L]|uniref:hypothetical protein n=1 Tax=Paraburkholderia sp. A3BS-1L TaxID=3028375 RepID=UPI003DA951A7